MDTLQAMYFLRPMMTDDYIAVYALMQTAVGLRLRDADSLEGVTAYLARNPGMSFVAESASEVVGCLMAGHDGRRGYLNHLVVAQEYRRQGIGRALVIQCLTALSQAGIDKTHVDVLADNEVAMHYWEQLGWKRRDDIARYSITPSDRPDA